MIDRLYHLHVYFCSSLTTRYILPYERDILANCREIRSLFHKMVAKRRSELLSDPHTKEGDLLSILLSDPLFNTDDEMIVDECLTFFFAGS
jgi:cytochrome P450